ncbi:thioredoxin domain-containing protein [Hymenobacter cellulosivorans]|uniref:Thioredoxin domain-containing protein n=1 Tax=Hymenobacter cellulosivorans TaxID=2932249 RepID=A0ABY4F832_9BACT|nr:thioredoxin domain-containing protein [Hymenobacter cellulosivorans]UOQ52821.1 thioredoxin domain-containing protein [Hymenobacter cellulosivorans]
MSFPQPAHTNRLSQETSPYLLQHAHNPVDWYPWGEEALSRAQAEQKPIIVSIGYAACHWCHVMERESFENPRIAEVMNQHFVCIKVDREERPDVDQVYMDALQAMGVQGGWPLNVFLNPDAKPFYGGTYFPPRSWVQLLESIGEAYQGEHRAELDKSAEEFARILRASDLEKYGAASAGLALSEEQFKLLVYNLGVRFDAEKGGMNRAPKFPMPSIWRFLLRCHARTGSQLVLNQTLLTLREMAWGGIYDQVGGGFARYSVDAEWLVPHFEKMLYDNGQLISLYAEAFQLTQDPLFRDVVYDTVAFIKRELTSPEGGFYSSLDADSEGEEGKFYVFTKEELQAILGDEEALFSAYYNCTALGNWEHGRNILHRRQSDAEFAAEHELEVAVLEAIVAEWKQKIRRVRNQRVRPGLDDKILTGWNALMLSGLVDAYRAFGEAGFLELALQNARFLQQNLRQGPRLRRNYKAGRATIDGFLEDYALVIQAYIGLYEVTFDAQWLHEAEALTQYVQAHFFDPEENQFFYTDDTGEKLIARKKELFDNVIPGSNSVMAHNLLRLSLHLEKPEYRDLAATMLGQVQDLVIKEPQHLTNWASLYAALLQPMAEIAIVGPEVEAVREELSRHFLPYAVVAGAAEAGELPLLLHRTAQNGKTTLYVCFNRACQQPVYSVAAALAQLPAPGAS